MSSSSDNGPGSGGYIDPNFPNPNGPDDVRIIIYGYTPSFPLALFAISLFGITFLLHLTQSLRYRTFYFLPLAIGLVLEIIGYIARALSAHLDPYRLIFFVIQYFFVVTAPVLISAAIYTVLSVLIHRVGTSYSPLPPRWVLGIFITCDIIATVVQVTGAALIGARYSKRQDPTGANHILLGGLAFQVFTFLVFLIMTMTFLYRCWRAKVVEMDRRMRGFLIAFLTATVLVYLRTVFRLAETSQGLERDLATREIYFAVLEFAPIAGAVLLFNLWHPGRFLGRSVR